MIGSIVVMINIFLAGLSFFLIPLIFEEINVQIVTLFMCSLIFSMQFLIGNVSAIFLAQRKYAFLVLTNTLIILLSCLIAFFGNNIEWVAFAVGISCFTVFCFIVGVKNDRI